MRSSIGYQQQAKREQRIVQYYNCIGVAGKKVHIIYRANIKMAAALPAQALKDLPLGQKSAKMSNHYPTSDLCYWQVPGRCWSGPIIPASTAAEPGPWLRFEHH
ncbi:hypothetical protein CEXT_637631 [Caerostris extrusa]|uniref:Uncharacterized protein n=1 Tax=Caerostris extrusa TaxID=172846 RepID=A0AAV4RLU8_CAEEX|nr:hypothetical protein CEXT_637631 [Caerostris extrusa]